MKKFMKRRFGGEKGFTLIELLVVVAILGVLAAVVVPNVGRFINDGQDESYGAELHNVETAVTAMLAASTAGELDAAVAATTDMDGVTADGVGGLVLSDFMTGLDADGNVTSGCSYAFAIDGTVTQSACP